MKKLWKKEKNSKKLERKGERAKQREKKGQRKGHSFRELSSHVKGSDLSFLLYFILQFIFHIWTIKPI